MFNKPKLMKLYVSSAMILSLVIVFLLLAVYFGMDAFEILSSGVYEGRLGDIMYQNDDPWGYWGGVFKYSSITLVSIYYALHVRNIKNKPQDVDR